MYKTMITNENEITKSDFDKLDEVKEFDKFTHEEIGPIIASLAKLISKSETEELNEEEAYLIKSGTAEIKNLTKYTINEMVDGRIVKNDVYCQEKQVKWLDVIEKSDTGEKIEKGIFLDTSLNRELGRVGITFEKGKSSKMEGQKDEVDYDAEMYKAVMSMVKGGDKDKNEVYKACIAKYPKTDKSLIKGCINKAYKDAGNDYLKKADIEIEVGDDDDDEEENGKEEKSKKKV